MKSIKEILEVAKDKNNVRHLRADQYNEAVALTEFLTELEQENSSFVLLSCSAKTIFKRTDKEVIEDSKTIVLGTYARFKVQNTIYYVQYNDNIFFEHFISIYKKLKGGGSEAVHSRNLMQNLDTSDILSKSLKGVKVIKEDLARSFKELVKHNYLNLNDMESQRIYYN